MRMPARLMLGLVCVLTCLAVWPATPAAQFSGPLAGVTAGPWRSLFDGTSLAAFRGYRMTTVPPGWRITDGTLTKDEKTIDLVTWDLFADFDLMLEWKIGAGGNAGIFYRGNEIYDHMYMVAPEYQLLDDLGAEDNRTASHLAGSLYDLIAGPGGYTRPVGFWNDARIIARGNYVEHWLNGVKVLDYEIGSATWQAALAASKFSAPTWPKDFATLRRGYIAFQGDHDGALAFRNIRVRELK